MKILALLENDSRKRFQLGPILAREQGQADFEVRPFAPHEGERYVVQFVEPRNRVDNTRLRDLTLMRLFRREEAAEGAPKPAMRSGERVVGYGEIARIELGAAPPPNVQVSGDTVVVKDEKGLSRAGAGADPPHDWCSK